MHKRINLHSDKQQKTSIAVAGVEITPSALFDLPLGAAEPKIRKFVKQIEDYGLRIDRVFFMDRRGPRSNRVDLTLIVGKVDALLVFSRTRLTSNATQTISSAVKTISSHYDVERFEVGTFLGLEAVRELMILSEYSGEPKILGD